MEKLMDFLAGKKTYIVAILIGVAGALQHLGVVIPPIAWAILAGLGLGAVRDAIK